MDKATAPKPSQTPAAASAASPAQPVVPVRSAKDAINAMYAKDSGKRLSDYLATSAKDVINANSRPHDNRKSATSLHRHSLPQHKMESARPSASGILRMAKAEPQNVPSDLSTSMDPLARKTAPAVKKRPVQVNPAPDVAPVVKTSLKLKPKKAPLVTPPRQLQNPTRRPSAAANPKGQTALAKLLASRQRAASSSPAATTSAEESVRVVQQAAQKVTQQPLPSAARPRRTSRGMMQDIVRPRRRPAPGAAPTDSVKQRFEPAPRDYTATTEVQDTAYTGFSQPTPEPATPPTKQPVEIYGLMDEEPTGKPGQLGVVEDYHPEPAPPASAAPAPDNNKYSIAGQSPFFLKSVTVEKRPLSDAPTRRSVAPEGTLYERPSTDPVTKKNHYDAPPKKETKKSIPTKPTVIIPASRRSHAPFIFLLILTIILGAAVGAFIYLCFFQYME